MGISDESAIAITRNCLNLLDELLFSSFSSLSARETMRSHPECFTSILRCACLGSRISLGEDNEEEDDDDDDDEDVPDEEISVFSGFAILMQKLFEADNFSKVENSPEVLNPKWNVLPSIISETTKMFESHDMDGWIHPTKGNVLLLRVLVSLARIIAIQQSDCFPLESLLELGIKLSEVIPPDADQVSKKTKGVKKLRLQLKIRYFYSFFFFFYYLLFFFISWK